MLRSFLLVYIFNLFVVLQVPLPFPLGKLAKSTILSGFAALKVSVPKPSAH